MTFPTSAAQASAIPHRPGWRSDGTNVVLIVLDDLGFAQLGCFGSDIDTPHLDQLAARGLRWTNFHTTALCAPTRAALLTGRNHHRVGMGWHPDLPMRYPGYHGRIPRAAGTLAEVLQAEGWATYAVGKWHLTPADERTPVGPHAHWPTGKGFDHFYGFLGGDTNQWHPTLTRDQAYVDQLGDPDHGYHLNADLADQAISYLRQLRSYQTDRPFFLYYATGAVHAPHQAPREWIDRYVGRFDRGWDLWREEVLTRQKALGVVPEQARLSPRPPWVDGWDSLSSGEKRFCRRTMEVFAGFLSHTDHHVGRVLAEIEAMGEMDRTVVVALSDNGASGQGGIHGSSNEMRFVSGLAEDFEGDLAKIDELGGYRTYNHYAWGWALAGNTPLQRWKKYTWEGGTRCPMIVHAPAAVPDPGGTRSQYCHVIDVYPTVLGLCGVDAPVRLHGVEQIPLDGIDMTRVLHDKSSPELRTTQYFELEGSRAIYHDGWKAVTNHVYQGQVSERELVVGSHSFGEDHWSLIDTGNDFSEVEDLSGRYPELVRSLENLWWYEAGRNNVMPLTDHSRDRLAFRDIRWASERACVTIPGGEQYWIASLPSLHRTDFRLTFDLDGGPFGEGVLAEVGDWTSGWAMLALDGRAVWLFNHVGDSICRVEGPVPGAVNQLELTFHATSEGGTVVLTADDCEIGRGEMPSPLPRVWNISGGFLRAGYGGGFPVTDDYRNPRPYTGRLIRLTIDTGQEANPDGSFERALLQRGD